MKHEARSTKHETSVCRIATTVRGFSCFLLLASLLSISLSSYIIIASTDACAYVLPDVRTADSEREIPAEEVLAGHLARLDKMARLADLTRIEEHRRNSKVRLSKAERRCAAEYDHLHNAIAFWETAVGLKRSIADLDKTTGAESVDEADAMAKIVIETLYRLSREYRVTTSAWIHNFLVTHGIKKKGHCYHYVDDLRKALSSRSWRFYDLHWAEAWPDDFRENNALVITAKDAPFEEGLAIDAWRARSRPFWTPVKGDRFPWKEAFGVEIE